ncbi:MAG: ATP synthase subunit I [Thermodesulfobacteriota bacterium]|nr:ATP synthase subunit I [Thermodesulfobacteriota bacterium]
MPLAGIHQRIETILYKRGFKAPEIRQLVRNQLYILVASSVAAAGLGWFLPAVLYFAMGVLLITFNFYSLAKFVQQLVFFKSTGKAIVELLLRFYGRLFLTGLILFVLIAWVGVSAAALLAGLSTVVVTIFLWGGSRFIGQKVKEA